MSGSTTPTLSAQDQNFLLTDTQNKLAESQIDSTADVNAGSVTVSELGRWFGVDYGRLIGTNIAVAPAVGGQVPTTPGAAQDAITSNLAGLTGVALDNAYLSDVITLKGQDTAGGATEISSGTNPTLVQVAKASNSLVTEHLQEAQYVQAALNGTTLPAISPSMPVAGPLLAPSTTPNAQDQSFITNVSQAGVTAVAEGQLATNPTLSPDLSLRMYGYWTRCENAQTGANVAAVAAAAGITAPTTISSAQTLQISTLGSFTGTTFEAVFAADQVSNDQVLVNLIKTEISSGSDQALVALANAVLNPAEQLLTQAVIESVQIGGGFTDAQLAPNTLVGSIVADIATAAGTGTLTIGNVSIGAPALASGSNGVLLIDVAGQTVSAPSGYGDILDIGGAATIDAAGGAINTVVGGAAGITYYGANGSGGTLLLNTGINVVEGAATGAGNTTVVGAGAGSNFIFAGAGNDVIATGAGNSLVGLGAGSNTVTSQGNDTILGGSGTDVIYGAGPSQVVFAGSGNLVFVGGPGTATVVTGPTAPVVLYGAAGGTLNLFGAASGNILAAGAGNETLQGASATGNNIFFGGSGTTTEIGGSGSDIFVAGTGAEVVTGGGGNNLFEFVSGATAGATDVITDFAASSGNRVLLAGYNGTTQSALNTAVVSGGNTTITLADSTKVEFLGVTNLTAANFG